MLKILAPIVFAFGISACVDDDVEQGPLPEDGETLTIIEPAVLDREDVAEPTDDGDAFDDNVIDGFEDVIDFDDGVDDPDRPGCHLRISDGEGETENPCRPQL